MELFVENDYLLFGDKDPDGERHVVRWPPGYHPLIGEDGVLEVCNGGGRTTGRVGGMLRIGGTGGGALSECNTSRLDAIQISNDDCPFIFNQHDSGRPRDPNLKFGYGEGWLEISNGCMNINYSDILIWPSDYTMRETSQGGIQVTDHNG